MFRYRNRFASVHRGLMSMFVRWLVSRGRSMRGDG